VLYGDFSPNDSGISRARPLAGRLQHSMTASGHFEPTKPLSRRMVGIFVSYSLYVEQGWGAAAAGSGSDAGADAVGNWPQRFVGRIAMPRMRELFKGHVSLDFSIRSCLPNSHIQHFAPNRVKEVGQMHQHAEDIR
jgi:hypothetical protein